MDRNDPDPQRSSHRSPPDWLRNWTQLNRNRAGSTAGLPGQKLILPQKLVLWSKFQLSFQHVPKLSMLYPHKSSIHVADFLFLMLPTLARTTPSSYQNNRSMYRVQSSLHFIWNRKVQERHPTKTNEAQRELCNEKFSSPGMDNSMAKPGFFGWQKKQIQTMDRSLMIQVRKVLCCGLGPWDCDIFNSPANNRKGVQCLRNPTYYRCPLRICWTLKGLFTVAYTHQGPSKVLHVSGKKSTKSSSSASRSSGSGEESHVKTGNIKSTSCWTFLIESYKIVMARFLSSCQVLSIAHRS